MRKFIGFGGIAVFLCCLVFAFLATRTSLPPEDPQIQQARTIAALSDIERQQHAADFWGTFMSVAVVVVFIVVVGSSIGYIGLKLWHGHQDANIAQRRELIRLPFVEMPLDDNGNALPYIDTVYRVVVQAQPGNFQQPVPYTLNYAPHNPMQRAIEAPAVVAQLGEPEIAPVPTFADLLAGNTLQPGKLLLGYGEEGAIYGTWKQLYSSVVAGVSGSGKTVTVSFLAAQSALAGARFVVMDPHIDAGEEGLAAILDPLRSSFVCEPAGRDVDELEAAIAIAHHELRKRLEGDATRTPFIVAIDELTSLLRGPMAKPIAGLLMDIAQEGRKVGIFALAMGQVWKGSTSGGTEVRDSFASAYVHRMKPNQARLLLPADEARQVQRLATGQAVLYRTNGELVTVTIPLTTGDDMTTVAAMLVAGNTITEATRQPAGNQTETIIEQVSTSSQSAKSTLIWSAEEMRVITLFKEGKDVAAIVREVYGEAAANGRRYQEASQQVQAIIRRFVSDAYGNAV